MLTSKSDSKSHIFRSAAIVGVFTLLSRLVGFYRDHLFASHFGAGDLLDSYYVAFRIPDLIFNLLVLGTLSAAFIPVFTEYFVKDKEEANKVANTILNMSFAAMALLSLVLFFFVPQLTKVIAPGFTGKKFDDTVMITRIFMLSPVIFTVSSLFSSVLNSLKRFFLVSLAPIIYNVGIIFGVIVLYPRFGLKGLAYGVILGALGHLFVQIPGSFKAGFKYEPVLDLKHPAVLKFVKLFLPRIIGVDSSQVSLLIASIIGSTLISGSIAIFNFANNLQAVAIGMFGISFAIAAFPSLSEDYAQGDEKSFDSMLARTAIHILYFVVPISVLIYILRFAVVGVVLKAGHFDAGAANATAQTLGVFSVSIFAQSVSPLLSRAFYARRNTWMPVLVGLISLGISAGLSYLLGERYGVVGLGVAFSTANVVNLILLFALLNRRLQALDLKYMFLSVCKIVISSATVAVISKVVLTFVVKYFPGAGFASSSVQLLVSGGLGALTYIAVTYFLGMNESRMALGLVKKRFFR